MWRTSTLSTTSIRYLYLPGFDSQNQTAHFEAFRDSGLANPTVTPSWNVDAIDNRHIFRHFRDFYFPGDRITVVGTGKYTFWVLELIFFQVSITEALSAW